MSEKLKRLEALCRQGDAQASLEMLREAYRAQDYRLFEIGVAGCYLCEDQASHAKKAGVMAIAAMSSGMWTSPVWPGILNDPNPEKESSNALSENH